MLASFLEQLFGSGKVLLSTARPLAAAETEAIDILRAEEVLRRADFPGEAPVFELDAGYWAARIFYRACQFFASRDLPVDSIRVDLAESCPNDASLPGVIYSVDLTFRYLPDLHRLARGVASADPLVEELERLARAWPLSGVGILFEEVPPDVCLGPVLSHSGLLETYVDRALASGQQRLLENPQVRSSAQSALGAYADAASGLCALRLEDS